MRQPKPVTFEGLVGEVFNFYGVDGNCFKLDGNVFEAIEDPDDGYRSFLDEVRLIPHEECEARGLVFFRSPIARVEVVESDVLDGHELIDRSDSHVWLVIGTDHYDQWYPQSVFHYTPKEE